MDNNEIKMLTRKEAIKYLTQEDSFEKKSKNSNSVFDIYGNYTYPFEAKISEPNIATGYIVPAHQSKDV